MRNSSRLFPLMVLLGSTLAACTQKPAEVVYKGSERHGRDSSSAVASRGTYRGDTSYSSQSYAPEPAASGPTESTVSVQSVGVSDLPPPAPAASAPSPSPAPAPATAPPDAGAPAGTASPYKPSSVSAAPGKGAFMLPVDGEMTSRFGHGDGVARDAVAIKAAPGASVLASADGEAIYVGDTVKGYGNMVILRHGGDITTAYAQLGEILVERYQRVHKGEPIGTLGKSGQVQFSVRKGKKPVDPETML